MTRRIARQLGKPLGLSVVLLVILAFAAVIFYHYQYKQHWQDLSKLQATVLDKPRSLVPFKMIDDQGKPFNKGDLAGHWTMLFFGFTNCPELCPTTMATLNQMVRLLQHQGVKKIPRVVMVSIDSERDTKAKLQAYVRAFNPDFIGAIADTASLHALTNQMGIVYMKQANKQGNYNINHTGPVMLVNPKGKLTAFFSQPHKASVMAHDYKVISSQETMR